MVPQVPGGTSWAGPCGPATSSALFPGVGHLGLFRDISPHSGRSSTLEQLPSKAVAPSHEQRPTAAYSFPFPLFIRGGDCKKKNPNPGTKWEASDKRASLKKWKVAFSGVTAAWL